MTYLRLVAAFIALLGLACGNEDKEMTLPYVRRSVEVGEAGAKASAKEAADDEDAGVKASAGDKREESPEMEDSKAATAKAMAEAGACAPKPEMAMELDELADVPSHVLQGTGWTAFFPMNCNGNPAANQEIGFGVLSATVNDVTFCTMEANTHSLHVQALPMCLKREPAKRAIRQRCEQSLRQENGDFPPPHLVDDCVAKRLALFDELQLCEQRGGCFIPRGAEPDASTVEQCYRQSTNGWPGTEQRQ